jgi:hypothetical protein
VPNFSGFLLRLSGLAAISRLRKVRAFQISHNVPAVYEMCHLARFTYIQINPSGVISLPYNELALLVQRVYTTTKLRDCGCDCNIRKRGSYEGKGCFFGVSPETEFGKGSVLLPML